MNCMGVVFKVWLFQYFVGHLGRILICKVCFCIYVCELFKREDTNDSTYIQTRTVELNENGENVMTALFFGLVALVSGDTSRI